MNLRKKTIRNNRLSKSQLERFNRKIGLAQIYGEKYDISPIDLVANMQTHVMGGGSFEKFWNHQSHFVGIINTYLKSNKRPPIKIEEIRAYYRRMQDNFRKSNATKQA